MDLRGCSQLHFIAVIRGGKIIRIPNIGQGKKTPKYLSIEQIYSSSESNCQDSVAKYPLKVNRSLCKAYDFGEVKTEVKTEYAEEENEIDFGAVTLKQLKDICKSRKRKSPSSVNLATVKQENSQFHCDMDELDLKETLGSLKQKVTKKIKSQKKGISKNSAISCTPSHLSCRLKDKPANLDLRQIYEPLSIKVEDAEYDYSQPQFRKSSIVSDQHQSHHEHLEIPVLVENSNFASSQASHEQLDCQNPLTFGNLETDEIIKVDSSVVKGEQPFVLSGSEVKREGRTDLWPCDKPSNAVLCEGNSADIQNGYPLYSCAVQPPPPNVKSICILNQVSCEHLDNAELQNPVTSNNPKIVEIINVDSLAVEGEALVSSCFKVKSGRDMIDLTVCDEPTRTDLLEDDSSEFQIDDPQYSCSLQPPAPDENTSLNVQVPCTARNSDCKDVEFSWADKAIESMDNNRDEELARRDATNYNSVIELDTCLPAVDNKVSRDVSISAGQDKQLPLLDVTMREVKENPTGHESNYKDVKLFENGEGDRFINDNTEAKATRGTKNFSAAEDEKYCLLDYRLESPQSVTSAVEDNQPLIHDTTIAQLSCSPEIQPSKDIDPIVRQIGSVEIKGLNNNKQEQQPPERLFSGRKTISPNSKESLCRAIASADMQDETQNLSCREKLDFEQNCMDTSPPRSSIKKARIRFTSKRLETSNMIEMKVCAPQTLKKEKHERKLVLKGSPPGYPYSVPAASTCSSSKSCSQNAIIFAERQMTDIERLATKILSELHSMKELVVDTLHSESRTCAASRYNTDKARVAVDNVKKIEETSKRWLAMMARDCTRFRRIMELSETTNASLRNSNDDDDNPILETKQDEQELFQSRSTVHKERKIVFADEAGENLCHVRILSAELES
ncbi:unnamed protein product [Amaranthus hypochondriacus]